MSVKKAKNVAVIFVSWDGPLGYFTGVGKLSNQFIESIPEIAKDYKNKVNLSFHVLAVIAENEEFTESSPGYNKKVHERTKSICREHNGKLHEVRIDTVTKAPMDLFVRWSLLSKQITEIMQYHSNNSDQVIVYLAGHPILGKVPYYYNSSMMRNDNLTMLVVPHNDFFCYHKPNSHFMFEQLEWESASLQLVNMFKNTYVASTSEYQIKILREHYYLPKNKVVPLQTGLNFRDKNFEAIPRAKIVKVLEKNNIPTNKDLIFSVGRAVPDKGFGELIKTFARLIKIHGKSVHLVIVASPSSLFGSAPNIEHLEKLVAELGLEKMCTMIYRQDFDLPRYLYQWSRTKIVAQLSIHESFGLVPEEVRISPNKIGPVVVASNVGGFKEQITNGEDGFLVGSLSYLRTAKVMSKILNMKTAELTDIKEAGLKRAKLNYDYTKNIKKSLDILLSK